MRLNNKVAFITGAGMGVGRATCLLFADEGSKIVAADIDQEAGQETVRLVKERGGEAVFTQCDVANEQEVKKAIEVYRFDKALSYVWEGVKYADKLINEKEVWNLKGKEKEDVLQKLVEQIRQIAYDLKPFLPETADKIEKQFQGLKVRLDKPLFPRLK